MLYKNKKKLTIFIFFSFIMIIPSIQAKKLKSSNIPVILDDPLDTFVIESTIPINIIFIGFNTTNINTIYINENVKDLIKPTYNGPTHQYMGGEFNLDYNYYFSKATNLETDFVTYLNSIESVITPPLDLQTYNPTAISAKQHSAIDTITWLDNHINNYFPNVNCTYCFYLIDLYTYGYIEDYHYYSINFNHPDTGTPSFENHTILYGGDFPNRGVFLDLSAGPIYYPDWLSPDLPETTKIVSPEMITPIWNYTFPLNNTDFNNNMIEYIRKIVDFIYLPYYCNNPILPEEYDNIKILIFDNTTNYEISNNPDKHINTTLIKTTFEELIPDSKWNITIVPEYLYNYPELEQMILEAQNYPEEGYERFDKIYNYFLMKHYYELGLGIFEDTIAVIIFALPNNIAGSLNTTWGLAYGNGLVIIDGGYNLPISHDYSYYSHLIIHEVGHEMGLPHPFEYETLDENDFSKEYRYQDWLFDFISTPMAYAHFDTSFSIFDRHSIARAHTIEYLKETWDLLYNANRTLLDHNNNTLNLYLENILINIQTNKSMIYTLFESEEFIKAHHHAKECYILAKLYYDYVIESFPESPPKIPGYEIEIITLAIGISIIGIIISIRKKHFK